MVLICINKLYCQSFTTLNDFYNHIENVYNQIPLNTLPIYQDLNIRTYTDLSCHLCCAEFTNKSNLIRPKNACAGLQLFFVNYVNILAQIV